MGGFPTPSSGHTNAISNNLCECDVAIEHSNVLKALTGHIRILRGIEGPEDGKVASGEVGSVVDARVVASEASGSEAMSALSDTGGGI